MKQIRLVLCVLCAANVAGCTTSSQVSANKTDIAKAARGIFGTSLIGVKGASPADQNNVDDAIAGACAAGAYTREECRLHQTLTEG